MSSRASTGPQLGTLASSACWTRLPRQTANGLDPDVLRRAGYPEIPPPPVNLVVVAESGDQAIAAICAGRAIGSARERSPTEPRFGSPDASQPPGASLAGPAGARLLLRADNQEKQQHRPRGCWGDEAEATHSGHGQLQVAGSTRTKNANGRSDVGLCLGGLCMHRRLACRVDLSAQGRYEPLATGLLVVT